MGVLGMSAGDFEGLTPEEFDSATRCCRRLTEERWEMTRAHACWILQPYSSKGKGLKPDDLCVFPWEKEGEKNGERRELSRADVMSEFARVKRERGLR